MRFSMILLLLTTAVSATLAKPKLSRQNSAPTTAAETKQVQRQVSASPGDCKSYIVADQVLNYMRKKDEPLRTEAESVGMKAKEYSQMADYHRKLITSPHGWECKHKEECAIHELASVSLLDYKKEIDGITPYRGLARKMDVAGVRLPTGHVQTAESLKRKSSI